MNGSNFTVAHIPIVMTLKQTLLIFFTGILAPLVAQNDCNNPITINSILVSNTTCSNNTGTVIISPGGGGGAFTFQWTSNVSLTNVATNLAAGAYNVHIERANDPSCFLDTIIVVNNSNGPQVQVNVEPARCLSNTGKVTLSPSNLLYSWNNGAGTSIVQGLAGGNYYVTATNPGTGCYSVLKVFVPRDYNFPVNAQVLQEAKCGQNIGQVQITVPNGSGQYSYSLGAGPLFNNLPAGNYACVVSDNLTGCVNTATFTINNLQVGGTVNLTPKNVRCAGGTNGQVEIEVVPGQNFELPFVFTLTNSNGQPQSPGNLVTGTYYLQVFDADQCPLPADTFEIQQPPLLLVQSQITPESCNNGGSITLSISGGNGAPYLVNWLDLAGDINPQNRSKLEAGAYSAIIFDSLFCEHTLNNQLVLPACQQIDTAHMVLKTSSTELFCQDPPVGFGGTATTYSLVGGGLSGSSAFGAWFLNTNGCLAYSAGPNAGFAVDMICIVRSTPQLGLKDTVCLIVSIVTKQPTKQTVFFAVQTGAATAACGSIPPTFQNTTIVQIGRPGLSGSSDAYGDYVIDPATGCLSFQAGNNIGYGVDEIRVAVCDTMLDECHVICYLPSVIEQVDCATVLQLPGDTVQVSAPNCDNPAIVCAGIPYDDIVNYTVIDNGGLYTAGYSGCDFQTRNSYNIQSLPGGGGPYQITEWLVNGQNRTGAFLTLSGLVDLMNLLDPNPGWDLQGANFIRGGNTNVNYGPLRISSATGVTANFPSSVIQAPLGTELRLNPGAHQVIFKNVVNACADTLLVQVNCVDCLPIHSNPLNAFGNVEWESAAGCDADTVFCTNIPAAQLGQYAVLDNGQVFSSFETCGNFVGLRLDTGFHLLNLRNTQTGCEYNVRFNLNCREILLYDTLRIQLAVGESQTHCLDTTLLDSPVQYLFNFCEDDAGSAVITYGYDQQNWCVFMTGLALGSDTLCLQMCDAAGQCVNYLTYVTVAGESSDSLLAVPDAVYTLKDTDVDIPILSNDIVNGIAGNRFKLASVEFLTQPALGTFSFNAISGLFSYSPGLGACGVDSVEYRITDSLGQQSTATVSVTIVCEKVLVFNGISPNGDGKNDVWHILGIEQYPQNEVRVFNRWGNQVFERSGYTNAEPWDGVWNGRDLPDGTYFYVIILGGGNGKQEGFLQILR